MAALRLPMRDELEQRYTKLRLDALNSANQVFDDPTVRLKLVDTSAFAAFKQWDQHPGRIKDWDWPSTLQEWKLKFPKRFEAVAWKTINWLDCRWVNPPMLVPDCDWIT